MYLVLGLLGTLCNHRLQPTLSWTPPARRNIWRNPLIYTPAKLLELAGAEGTGEWEAGAKHRVKNPCWWTAFFLWLQIKEQFLSVLGLFQQNKLAGVHLSPGVRSFRKWVVRTLVCWVLTPHKTELKIQILGWQIPLICSNNPILCMLWGVLQSNQIFPINWAPRSFAVDLSYSCICQSGLEVSRGHASH